MNLDGFHQIIAKTAIHDRHARPISSRGGLQDWLIDLRPLLLRRDVLLFLAQCFWTTFEGHDSFQIAGLESAAIPLLAAVLIGAPEQRKNVNALVIRKDRKPTGLGNRIEGQLTHDAIIAIDDILNSGASAEKAALSAESKGGRMTDLFVLIDYASKAGTAWRRRRGVRVHALFTLADFSLTLKAEADPVPDLEKVWSVAVKGGFPFHLVPKSAPVYNGGRVFRGCDAGLMHAFDAASGDIIWAHRARGTSPTKGIWSTPAVNDGRVVYGAYNGVVYCLNASSGEELWTQPCCDWIGSSPLIIPHLGLVYIGLEFKRPWAQGSLAALDVRTGAKVWEQVVTRYQHGSAAYFAGGDLIIWGSADHQMLALEPRTGRLVWSFATRRSVKCAAAVCEERGWVAFASFDQSIYVLDARNGDKLFEFETDDICYTTPLFVENKLFCGSGDKHLYVIDLDRREISARLDLGSRVYASPALIEGSVYVGNNGGTLLCIDPCTLAITGRTTLADAVTNAVGAADDQRLMFVSTSMNDLVAIKYPNH